MNQMFTSPFWGVFHEVFRVRSSIRALKVPFCRLAAFSPLYEAKISNRSLSVVYGSITLKFFRGLWELVRTSGSTDETNFKKTCFGKPYCTVYFARLCFSLFLVVK